MDEQLPSISQQPSQSMPPPSPPPEQPEVSGGGGGDEEEEDEEEEEEDEDEGLISKAQKFMEMITSSPDNPNPKALHALASLLETQESRLLFFSCCFFSVL